MPDSLPALSKRARLVLTPGLSLSYQPGISRTRGVLPLVDLPRVAPVTAAAMSLYLQISLLMLEPSI